MVKQYGRDKTPDRTAQCKRTIENKKHTVKGQSYTRRNSSSSNDWWPVRPLRYVSWWPPGAFRRFFVISAPWYQWLYLLTYVLEFLARSYSVLRRAGVTVSRY